MEGIIFKIKDLGLWYTIDSEHPYPELYDDVPRSVMERAEHAIDNVLDKNKSLSGSLGFSVDSRPFDEAALRNEFDDVEFVSSDWEPYIIN